MSDEFPLIWRWQKGAPDRVGQRCRRRASLSRAKMEYEFEDGTVIVGPGFAAGKPKDESAPPLPPRPSHEPPDDVVTATEPSERRESEPEHFTVELAGGTTMKLASADEKVMWETTRRRYIADYKLAKVNDLQSLDGILSQVLLRYRAQLEMQDPKKAPLAAKTINEMSAQIRAGEKALGIDKVGREKGGHQTTADYISRLKRAGHEKGVHISERTLKIEGVMMEGRTKVRMLRNLDAEDLAYHGLSPESFIDWFESVSNEIEEWEKAWAREKGALFVGRL